MPLVTAVRRVRTDDSPNTPNASVVNSVIPMIDQVRHRISILERQLPAEMALLTRDNVEVILRRPTSSALSMPRSVYRVQNIDQCYSDNR